MSGENGESPPPSLGRLASGFYLLVVVASVIWNLARTGAPLPASALGGHVGTSLLLGAGCGFAVVLASRWVLERIGPFRWLAAEIRRLLGPFGPRTAAILAVSSAIGEELFFRGAMQPVFGYVPTSLVFGLVHSGPERRYLVWTAFAAALGFAFGGILLLTGSLAGPILAHAIINFLNLLRIGRIRLTGPALSPV